MTLSGWTDKDLTEAAAALSILVEVAPLQTRAGSILDAAYYADRTRGHDPDKTIAGVRKALDILRKLQEGGNHAKRAG